MQFSQESGMKRPAFEQAKRVHSKRTLKGRSLASVFTLAVVDWWSICDVLDLAVKLPNSPGGLVRL